MKYDSAVSTNLELQQKLEALDVEHKDLQNRNVILRNNLVALHKTAMQEIRKRDNEIISLQKQLSCRHVHHFLLIYLLLKYICLLEDLNYFN